MTSTVCKGNFCCFEYTKHSIKCTFIRGKNKCNKVHYSAILYTRKHETIISIKLKRKKITIHTTKQHTNFTSTINNTSHIFLVHKVEVIINLFMNKE